MDKVAPGCQIFSGLVLATLSIVAFIESFSPIFCFGQFVAQLMLLSLSVFTVMLSIKDFPWVSEHWGFLFTSHLRKGMMFEFLGWLYFGCQSNAFYIVFGLFLVLMGGVFITSEFVGPLKGREKDQLKGTAGAGAANAPSKTTANPVPAAATVPAANAV